MVSDGVAHLISFRSIPHNPKPIFAGMFLLQIPLYRCASTKNKHLNTLRMVAACIGSVPKRL